MIGFFNQYFTSLRISRLGKDGVLKLQERRFRHLLRYACQNSEFYRNFYAGIDPDRCRLTDIPILTKSVMMENFDRLITDSRLKRSEIQEWIADENNSGKLYLNEFQATPTSGSSGEYALVVSDRKALDLIQASLFARHPLLPARSIYRQTGRLVRQLLGRKERIAVIVMPQGNMGGMVKSVPKFGRLFAEVKLISLFDPIDQIVATLNRFQPDGLTSNSFFLGILAQEQLAGNLNISFRHPASWMAGGGEPLTEHTKQLAQKAWNIAVQDDYGAQESFFMAASCKECGTLHAMNDLCILEPVDGDGNPVPVGKYGNNVLVTNLANFIQPIIRYQLDDIVGYAGQPCKCGLPFPTLLPIQGRTTDFMYFEKPDGRYERFHPYRFRIPLYYVHEIRQYQIVQNARNELTFFYVPQSDFEGGEQKLSQTLESVIERAGLQSRITLKVKPVDHIGREKRSGKFKIVKSLGTPVDLDGKLDKRTY